jgi:hypothetical protein
MEMNRPSGTAEGAVWSSDQDPEPIFPYYNVCVLLICSSVFLSYEYAKNHEERQIKTAKKFSANKCLVAVCN